MTSDRKQSTTIIDGQYKGIPPLIGDIPIEEIGRQGWSLLKGDLPLPAAIIRESALQQNSRWMRRFLEYSGALLCPHGKTTMSPQLFKRQIDDGSWGITISTVQQLCVARRHGIKRILMANQLVGIVEIRYVVDELARDPEFDFFCIVDSIDGVKRLSDAAREGLSVRPLQVLVEGGYQGGRTGCRTVEEALRVAREVRRAYPHLALCGVEGYEGTLLSSEASEIDTAERVRDFVKYLNTIATSCYEERLFSEGPVLLSAGGSAFYDVVAESFSKARLGGRQKVVLRSGCYLTHDIGIYKKLDEAVRRRLSNCEDLGPGPVPALEVWTYVQSAPESNLVILTAGRRDCGHDAGLPVPLKRFRPRCDDAPVQLSSDFKVIGLNDQHAYLQTPAPDFLRVGDMVALGISHPCTTFDKWRILFIVNDDYRVGSAIETFF